MKSIWVLAIAVGTGMALSGCVESQAHLSDSFGAAVRQDMVGQIADPDARYPRARPAASGHRTALAQDRYATGTSIEPSGSASKIGLENAPQQQAPGPQGGPGPGDAGPSGP